MDKEHETLIDYFYERILTKSKEIVDDRIAEIEEEFDITADGLSVDDQVEYWRKLKKEEVAKAKGKFGVPLKKLSKKNFLNSYSSQSSKEFLKEKYNLTDKAKLEFIYERAYHYAIVSVIEIIKEKMEALIEGKRLLTFILTWTGKPNELVQIVYGLYCAKKINNGEGEITKILDSFTKLFGIKNKNLLSNHSINIHYSHSDYAPNIFDEAKEAYLKFREKKLEDNKKRKE